MNKYCPNCVHYITYERVGQFCDHPEALDLTGKLRSLWELRYADNAPCGLEGKLYEEKPPMPVVPKPVSESMPEPPKAVSFWRRWFA